MQPPFLVDHKRIPHELKYQRLVPGREKLTDSQIESLLSPYFIRNDQGLPEMISDSYDIVSIGAKFVKNLVQPIGSVELK